MSVTQFRLARACRRERQVIQAMRLLADGATGGTGAASDGRSDCRALFAPECQTALQTLARMARRLGYAIQPTGHEYISQDERSLVGWIALLQRNCCDVSGIQAGDLHQALRLAAEHLRMSHLLPYQTVFKAAPGMSQTAGTKGQSVTTDVQSGHLGQPVLHQSIRARAVAFARQHGRVSAKQLSEIGVTSPYLKALRKRGALIRVQQGIYEAPPHGTALLGSGPRRPTAHVGSRQRWNLAAIPTARGKTSPNHTNWIS